MRGWDYLMQWDAPPAPGVPLDQQATERHAWIQVKSCRQDNPVVSLKLSNAKRYAEATDPWFIVLYHKPKDGKITVYVRHFDHELIEETLRSVRKADNEQKFGLHQINFNVPMRLKDRHTKNYINWIKEKCRAKPADYERWKSDIFNSVGFDKAVAVARFSLKKDRLRDFEDHYLGLNPDFRPDQLEIRDVRFGLVAGTAAFEGIPEYFKLTAQPRSAELIVRSSGRIVAILKGDLRLSNLPFSSSIGGPSWAFSCEHVKIQYRRSEGTGASYRFRSEQKMPISELKSSLRLAVSLLDSTADCTIKTKGGQVHLGTMTMTATDHKRDAYTQGAEALESISSYSDTFKTVRISYNDLREVGRLVDEFNMTLKKELTIMKLDRNLVAITSDAPHRLLGFSYLPIANHLLVVFLEMPLLEATYAAGKTVATFDSPRILKTWMGKGTINKSMPRIARDHQVLLRQSIIPTISVNEGDLIKAFKEADSIRLSEPEKMVRRKRVARPHF